MAGYVWNLCKTVLKRAKISELFSDNIFQAYFLLHLSKF